MCCKMCSCVMTSLYVRVTWVLNSVFLHWRNNATFRKQETVCTRASQRYVGAPGSLIIWRPLKQIFFKLFRPRTGLALAQIADNSRKNSSACGNLSLLAPHFRLFVWCISAPSRLATRAAARLARPLVRSWFSPSGLRQNVRCRLLCWIRQKELLSV